MALTAYQQQVQRLLNDEAAQFYNVGDLTQYINMGRADIARQTNCLVATTNLVGTTGVRTYALSSMTAPSGMLSPIAVRSISQVALGVPTVLDTCPWQWFVNYYLNGQAGTVISATTQLWSQQTQGASSSVFFYPIPSGALVYNVEALWLPVPLSTDATPEAIPEPWATCVPYFGAYIALIQARRLQDAQTMSQLYDKYIMSARLGVTPNWNALNFPVLQALPASQDPNAPYPGSKPAEVSEGKI